MPASALKKLPVDSELRNIEYITPIKPLELPELQPIVSPVETKPPTSLTKECLGSPGPGWETIREAKVQGEHIHPGLYLYSPDKARLATGDSRQTWLALNRWNEKVNPNLDPLPPRPAQPDEAIWPQPNRNGVTYISG